MLRRQGGFAYLIAMFLVAILGIVSLRGMENSVTRERREKEAELLVIGQAYRNAIRDYYENSPGTAKTYPPDVDALLLDQRATRVRRPLRKLYRDPITSGKEWGIIRAESGGVMGIYSLSALKPYKTDGFPDELSNFINAKRYQDWQFVYQPH